MKNYLKKSKLFKKLEIWNEYRNPFYIWWKCRKYFKFPSIKTYIGKLTWFFGFPIRTDYLNKFVDFRMSALGWKDKYNSPRHEWDPYISIVLFRKWQLIFTFNYAILGDDCSYTRDIATWEAMLDIVYNNKSLQQVVNEHQWCKSIDNRKEVITIKDNLTNEGLLNI